ncbi:hypothetical protein ACM25N_08875 [Roseovarius sp. C7]|uniref:hypothetical protein n=1 Tax=Roseovarius sp. C7 TaxID=3398643 RepID=UPI0039F6FAA8
MAFLDVKAYEPWSQVLLLHNSDFSLYELTEHFHFARYLAAYPGLMLEDDLPGLGYSVFVSVIVSLNVVLFRRFYRVCLGSAPSFLMLVIFVLIHIAMNGRGPIGWFGWLLCLDLFARFNHPANEFSLFTVGSGSQVIGAMLFSSVSSGVFIVVFVSIIYLFIRWMKLHEFRDGFYISRLVVSSLVAATIGYVVYRAVVYAFDAISKILEFFGSFSDVISHGLGAFELSSDGILVLFAICIGGVSVFFVRYVLRDRLPPDIWTLLCIAMVGGAFGFTTLTLTIPLFLVLMGACLSLLASAWAREAG